MKQTELGGRELKKLCFPHSTAWRDTVLLSAKNESKEVKVEGGWRMQWSFERVEGMTEVRRKGTCIRDKLTPAVHP